MNDECNLQKVNRGLLSVRSDVGRRRAPNGTLAGSVLRLGYFHDDAADTHTDRDVDQVGGSHEDDAREERGYFRRVAADLGAIFLRIGNKTRKK